MSSVILMLPDGSSMGMEIIGSPYDSNPSRHYWQHSEFKWTVAEQPMSAADRLNGMTWKGSIRSTMAAYRELFELSTDSSRCWYPWSDLPTDHNLKWSLHKARGQWKSVLEGVGISRTLVGNALPKQADAERVLKLPLCP